MSSSLVSAFVVCSILLSYASAAEAACKAESCLGVTIYYESLCGDSRRFISSQLVPTYPELKDYLDIFFVPYGKASHERDGATGEWKFSCQHGPPECDGNKAQACGLHAIKAEEKSYDQQRLSVEFVGCVMAKSDPAGAVRRCAESVGLKNSTQLILDDCQQSNLADTLLVNYGEITHSFKPPISFVPTIVINDKYSWEDQMMALTNFKKLICNYLPQNDKPLTCHG